MVGVADKGLVLVVEDEPAIAELQRLYLSREGFGVHVATDGPAGLEAARRLKPVAVVLDVGLPGMDGTEVCRALREAGDWVPVLFVTARDDEVDRVLGLELGADDYVTKPFSPRELVSRVRAVLRRTQGTVAQPPLLLGPLRIDLETREVTVDDVPVSLTVTEFDLLAALVRKPGRVLSREQLLSQVWGYEAAAGTRTVDVHVGQVRAKLGAAGELVRTVRGVGYCAARL
ncbi:MAG: response regulator transcription factor [Mycobacteriales bacterium]